MVALAKHGSSHST